ncbi:MAG: methylmalonyl Co-A mutase-associated GTPase MeaB, partial [Phototrophicaceae bacterium]
GQSEVEIASTAHTVIVVEAPGMGDGVQAIKAGILEIADLLVVNKADHPHAIQTVRALEMMLELGHPTRPQTVNHHGQAMTIAPSVSETPLWIPPVLQTIATDGTGIEALLTHIRAHYTHLVDQGELQARVQSALQHEFTDWLREAVFEQFLRELPTTEYASLVQDIQSQQISPRQAAQLAVQLWRNSL